jgi:anaerobic ribonucleoside-triphosphate reductase activating protein
VPESLPFDGGTEISVRQLADELAALPDIEGVSFSGGEPMAQAAALVRLIDFLRTRRDFSYFCYTGYVLDHLQRKGTAAQRALLERLDVLVDGPYLPARHTDLRWRGSDNQVVHLLTARYEHLRPTLSDRGRWMEFNVDADETMHWAGIPPRGFREQFATAMRARGILIGQPTDGGDES